MWAVTWGGQLWALLSELAGSRGQCKEHLKLQPPTQALVTATNRWKGHTACHVLGQLFTHSVSLLQ